MPAGRRVSEAIGSRPRRKEGDVAMWMTYSEPQYLEITDEWREKFERFREEHANDPEGNVARTTICASGR
jgi:hypothetical protein